MDMPARMFAAIVFLAILSGCSSITTDIPVGTSGGSQTDARLVGGWRVVEANSQPVRSSRGEGYLYFLPRNKGGYTGIWMAWDEPPSAKPDIAQFDIVTGRLGATETIDARMVDENGTPGDSDDPGYWPGLYHIDGDGRLHIYIASDDGIKLVEAAVRDHRLAGTSEERSEGKDDSGKDHKTIHVHITAEPKSLDAYFAANASLIFTQPIYTLEKVH